MLTIDRDHIVKLVAIEAHVHYGQPPPPGVPDSFLVVRRHSPVLLSAPHGARTYRDDGREIWHDEDEYTAGMALLLSELCGTSALATIYRTDDSDPNYHRVARSAYKQALQHLVRANGIRWVIDLHAAGETRLAAHQLVDLGTRREKQSLPLAQVERLTRLLESRLGAGTVSHNVYPARRPDRTITAFSHGTLGLHAVQVESKTSVRVPLRRTDASTYVTEGPFAAEPERVIAFLQALVAFVGYLHELG
jgi:hypothetical protein